MIEALLRGKLNCKQENMEDILTSNVFGMLQYVPPKDGLFPFLARARTADADGNQEYPLQNLWGGLEAVKYEFWPNWQDGVRHIQPDVALHIRSGTGASYLVGVEAKYRSGKSSEAEKIDEEAEKIEERASAECRDQLAKEWIALVDAAAIKNAKPILIYLTADFGCPRDQICDSLGEHRRKRPDLPEPLIRWLSWRELADLFDKATDSPILLAIARMAEKLGLTFFRGITEVAPICVTWRFNASPQVCQRRLGEPTAAWHFHMAPIVSQWRFKR